ncbi:POK9 protein, partial [Calyptomena viridis]|nr:POK9 protein [Calyptomena viridis]
RGSLGLDLAAAVTVMITTFGVHRIPTGLHGPILDVNSKIGALLVGRSSTGTAAGLVVLPGVIDADYTGEIMVMAYALLPPIIVKWGTWIAQLLLWERMGPQTRKSQKERRDQGFGSTGATLVNLAQQMQQRPVVTLTLLYCGKSVTDSALMDTGANVTIIS